MFDRVHLKISYEYFSIFEAFLTQPAITCSKLTIKILERGLKYVQSSGVFIVNFEYITHFVLVFLLSTLSM